MILANQIGKPIKLIISQSQNNQSNRLLLLITHWGSMGQWFHPIFGKVEPWNHATPRFHATHFGLHGSILHILGSKVPLFHPKIFNFQLKFCWVEP